MNEVRDLKTIGIPRGLMCYRDGLLWKTYFEKLGYSCLISRKSDREVLESEYIGCHPCINTSSIRLKTRDLIEIVIPAMGHEPQYVTL